MTRNIIQSMRMYHFSSGTYGEEYHVMATSKEDALGYLSKYCDELEMDLLDCMKTYYTSQYEFFKNNPQFIFEFGEGEVLQTEVS